MKLFSLCVRLFVAWGLLLHGNVSMAHGLPSGTQTETTSLMCGVPGHTPSAASIRTIEKLEALLDLNPEEDAPDGHACSVCVIAGAILLPMYIDPSVLKFHLDVVEAWPQRQVNTLTSPRGPPVGATGPPLSI